MESLEPILWAVLATLVYMWLRDRVRHALYQKQREDFWREVTKKVEQKRKIDALYGRGRDNR
tara:strand:+ start:401 stop:586 length:186 start_codon:yes stop_codon:yes gene_type:complete